MTTSQTPLPLVGYFDNGKLVGIDAEALPGDPTTVPTLTRDASSNPTDLVDPRTGNSVLGGYVGSPAGAAAARGAAGYVIERAAAVFARNYVSGTSKLRVTGDSYGVTIGASNGVADANTWAGKLRDKYAAKLSWANGSVPSQTIGSYIQPTIQQETIRAGDVSAVLVGLNQIRRYGPSPEVMMDTVTATEAMLAWLAVPDAKKVRMRDPANNAAGNPAVTFTGSWSHNYGSPAGQYIYSYSTTPSAAISTQVTGGTVYIWLCRKATDAGRVSVVIDGYDYGAHGTGGLAYDNWVGGWEPHLIRVGGLSKGTHTVTVTMYQTGTFVPVAIAGFNRADDSAIVLAGQALRLTNTGWGLGSGTSENLNDPGANVVPASWSYGNGSLKDALWAAVSKAVANLQEDGLCVIPVDTAEGWDPAIHIGADNIHPSGSGHGQIFKRVNSVAGAVIGA